MANGVCDEAQDSLIWRSALRVLVVAVRACARGTIKLSNQGSGNDLPSEGERASERARVLLAAGLPMARCMEWRTPFQVTESSGLV